MGNVLGRIAGLVLMFGILSEASAGSITYNIVDMPADQNGFTTSGTITTDGVIGNLANSDITSWSVTISQGGTSETFTTGDGGPIVNILNNLVATASEINVPPADNFAVANDFELLSVPPGGMIIDEIRWVNSPQPIYMAQVNFSSPPAWNTSPPVAGTNWVIATAVPEPSTLTMFGVAVTCVAGVLGRRASRRAP
jgi:PEP-CTERM motif